jgi:hypothetical protein
MTPGRKDYILFSETDKMLPISFCFSQGFSDSKTKLTNSAARKAISADGYKSKNAFTLKQSAKELPYAKRQEI